MPDGRVRLDNGVHRWVVARELGIDNVPVDMRTETESAWAWEPGDVQLAGQSWPATT